MLQIIIGEDLMADDLASMISFIVDEKELNFLIALSMRNELETLIRNISVREDESVSGSR